MTRVLIFLLLLAQHYLLGQRLSKQNLVEDLNHLNTAVVNGHPVNYRPDYKTNIQALIDRARRLPSDSISRWDYTLWIEKGIYNIGCIHTSIKKNPLLSTQLQSSFIPLMASIQDAKLWITACADSTKVGYQIEELNGIKASEIVDTFKEFKASDGMSPAFAREYFHLASSKLLSGLLQYPAQYHVKTTSTEFDLKGTSNVYQSATQKDQVPAVLSNQQNSLSVLDDFAVLKIRSFDKSDKAFFKAAFEKLGQSNRSKLLLDLRQNTGGNRSAAVELTKHLVDTAFGYSILQPKLTTKKYLNQRGKYYLFLSTLKYNLGNFYKGRKTALGREFRYSYRPTFKNNFKGKLYVLTDGFTASASTMVTSWLKQFTRATFVGEQAGGGYCGNNGGSFPLITLPNSKIIVTFPAYRLILNHQSADHAGIIPDVPMDANLELKEIIGRIKE